MNQNTAESAHELQLRQLAMEVLVRQMLYATELDTWKVQRFAMVLLRGQKRLPPA